MGTGASHTVSPGDIPMHLNRTEAEIVNLMMPVYFTEDVPSEAEISRARYVWNMIINDTSPHYLESKAKGTNSFGSCVMYFYDTFYNRLFDVHPLCRSMFKSGLKTQGKFLVKMISMLVTDITDTHKFESSLVKLAEVHNDRGVKAIEYGIMGEVLFWALAQVTGAETYDQPTQLAWIRIYSRILTIVVPIAVAFEMKTGGQMQRDRVNAEQVMQRQMLDFETPNQSAAPSRVVSAKIPSSQQTESVNPETISKTDDA